MNTKVTGERTEAIILAELLKKGKTVLIPWGDNQRYDFVIDEKGKFIRIQCKTGKIKNGSILFNTCSSYAHRGGKRKSYRGEIEYFAVYCPETEKVYLVSCNDVPEMQASLRVQSTKNKQEVNVRWAKNYEL